MKQVLAIGSLLVLSTFSAHAILDTNDNGLSDVWERAYNNGQLFDSSFDPQVDSDSDGWTNELEAIAGTDPFDANSSNGFVRPVISRITAVLGDIDESEVPEIITPDAFTITWQTIPGKQYGLFYSTDLVEWLAMEPTFIGNGSELEYGIPLPDADKLFWRVTIEDIDTDDDGLTDAEECALGTNPLLADTDGDGWSDRVEITNGTSSTNPDTDGDGIPDNIDPDPLVAEQVNFSASSLMVISPQQ